jgi:predicted transcriptional regulator
MRKKYAEQRKAILMRKNGKTLLEIATKLEVSKASVSLWVKNITLPKKALQQIDARKNKARTLASQARRNQTLRKLHTAKLDAKTLVDKKLINPEMALLLCAVMYWCEGAKSKNDSEFTFTNAEPLLVKGFLNLLRIALPLDEKKFRIKMHLHQYHDERTQKKFWSKVTRIPESQFQNTYLKSNSAKNIKLNYPGCIHIRYHDVTISRQISAIARNFLSGINVLE